MAYNSWSLPNRGHNLPQGQFICFTLGLLSLLRNFFVCLPFLCVYCLLLGGWGAGFSPDEQLFHSLGPVNGLLSGEVEKVLSPYP